VACIRLKARPLLLKRVLLLSPLNDLVHYQLVA
jgi:hypothetical protein